MASHDGHRLHAPARPVVLRALLLLGALWLTPSAVASGQEAPSLAEQAVDPTASLMSFQFIDNYTPALWDQDGTSNSLLFRAAIPFVAWRKPNIFRVSVPYTSGGTRGSGLEGVQLFDLLIFTARWGRWGVGPLLSLQQDFRPDGPGPFGIGPAIGFTMRRGRWTLGLFSQNLFGDGLAASSLQPIAAYLVAPGTTLSLGDAQIAYDWNEGELTRFPLSIQLGHVRTLAGQPIRLFVNPQYNLADQAGADQWTLAFGFAVLAPLRTD
jgi:hypothetical protein